MNDEKLQISLEVPMREKISRLFIFRFLWIYILIFPLFPALIVFGLVSVLHFWYMLILGKRHEWLFNTQKKVFVWLIKWQAYLSHFVDQRPGFWY